jgi:UDP-glucuronate 4-epimerase
VYGANEKSPMSESDRTDRQLAVYGVVSEKANEALAHAYNHLYGIEAVEDFQNSSPVYGTSGRPESCALQSVKNIAAGQADQMSTIAER